MAMQTDPVCGMQVDDKSADKSQYQGTNYYFCSADCKRKFDQQPAAYAGSQAQAGQGGGQSQQRGASKR